MDSTELTTDEGLAEIYRRKLLPWAERLRRENVAFFPAGGEPGANSYYRRRTHTTMSKADFEALEAATPEAVGSALRNLWAQQGPEWSDLAATCQEIAKASREQPEQSDDVSPLIYVMF